MKVCREILIFEIFVPWGPFAQHDLHIFSYSNFRWRYLHNQSDHRKSLTHFCWLMTVQPFCLCCSIWYPINPIKNLWSFHVLPAPDTSLKEKLLKLYFYCKLHFLSFLLIYSLLGFWWIWHMYKFLPERHQPKWEVSLSCLWVRWVRKAKSDEKTQIKTRKLIHHKILDKVYRGKTWQVLLNRPSRENCWSILAFMFKG